VSSKDLLIFFGRKWEARYGKRYNIAWAKDGAIFKRLLATYSSNDLENYISYYLSDFVSDFASRAGHSIGVFVASLPSLVAGVQNASKKAALPVHVSEDWERLQRARRTDHE
jgi:hypothetical protein